MTTQSFSFKKKKKNNNIDYFFESKLYRKNGRGHLGVESGYDVKTDNDQNLAVGRYVVSTVNSYSEYTYDTVDKKNELLITLPNLFKDDGYLNLINENLKEQMRRQMELVGLKNPTGQTKTVRVAFMYLN